MATRLRYEKSELDRRANADRDPATAGANWATYIANYRTLKHMVSFLTATGTDIRDLLKHMTADGSMEFIRRRIEQVLGIMPPEMIKGFGLEMSQWADHDYATKYIYAAMCRYRDTVMVSEWPHDYA